MFLEFLQFELCIFGEAFDPVGVPFMLHFDWQCEGIQNIAFICTIALVSAQNIHASRAVFGKTGRFECARAN